MGLVNIKPEIHGGMIAGIISGFMGIIGIITTTTVKVFTRNHLTRKEADLKFSTQDDNHNLEKLLSSQITGLGKSMDSQFASMNKRLDDVVKVVLDGRTKPC